MRRLVSVGLASVLPTAAGAPLMDTPDHPQEWRAFYVGHGAGTEALRASAPEGLRWAVPSPSGEFADGEPTGGYAFAPADATDRITDADFARTVPSEAGFAFPDRSWFLPHLGRRLRLRLRFGAGA
ncbi:hypothetical protein JYK04_01651 [Streptomyces nojiriensis]|nr:hypothetical protein JYK04_01651 [Streptomyces nojiriensis]